MALNEPVKTIYGGLSAAVRAGPCRCFDIRCDMDNFTEQSCLDRDQPTQQHPWQDEALGENEYVISADEKTSIQARCRCFIENLQCIY
jgi:hypothetical protein